VSVDELLYRGKRGVLELNSFFWHNLLNLSQKIQANVLVSNILKNLSGQFSALKTLGVNEMAKFAASTARGSMKVSAGDGAVVSWLD
jgi:hypothetical protein